MSSPAKNYPELSGCMTCNTKLTVLNPGPRPDLFTRDREKPAARLLLLDVLKARAFLQPCVNPYVLMTSSNFICARSSVPVSGVKQESAVGRISSLYPSLWHFYRTGVICEHEGLCKMILSPHKQSVNMDGNALVEF